MIVVIPALKNNGDENKPDKNTIVEQISSASVIVNGDLKIQKCVKFYNFCRQIIVNSTVLSYNKALQTILDKQLDILQRSVRCSPEFIH